MLKKKLIIGVSANVIHGGATIIFNYLMSNLPDSKVIFNRRIESQLNSSNKNIEYIYFHEIRKNIFYLLNFFIHFPYTILTLKKFTKNATLIIANDFISLIYLSFINLFRKKLIIFYCHTAFRNTRFNKVILSKFVNLFSNIIITPSNYLKSELTEIGIIKSKIILIYNGIPLPPYKIQAKRNSIIQVGIIGVVNYQKGQDIFAESLQNLKKQGYKITGYIVGQPIDRNYCNKIRSNYADLINEKQLIMMDHLSHNDIISLIEKLDIVVCLSRYMETLPTVLLEAMALKKAIIGTKVGGISEIIINHQNGILIEPSNSKELVEALKFIIDNNLSESYGNNGFAIYQNKFNESKYLNSFNEVIESVN